MRLARFSLDLDKAVFLDNIEDLISCFAEHVLWIAVSGDYWYTVAEQKYQTLLLIDRKFG